MSSEEVTGERHLRIVVWGPRGAGKSAALDDLLRRIHGISPTPHPLGQFVPFSLGAIRGIRWIFDIVEAPGDAALPTKLARLAGAHGVVFVADSRIEATEANLASSSELTDLLTRLGSSPDDVPFVFLHNKRDAEHPADVSELDAMLNMRQAPSFTAVATRGDGVMDAVKGIAKETLKALAARPVPDASPAWLAQLDADLDRALVRVSGRVPDDRVLFRPAPGILDGVMAWWPANAIGKQRMLRRPDGGVLFVTQGLSFPFSPSLHQDADRPPLGYELGIELAHDEPIDHRTVAQMPDDELANCWAVWSLWFLADVAALERMEFARRLERFGALTTRGHEQSALTPFALRDDKGGVGYLLGARLPDVTGLPMEWLAPDVRLIIATLAHPTEIAHAMRANDGSGVFDLLNALGSRAHLSSRVRPPVR